MSKCDPYFVRCIKPNAHKQPGDFDDGLVLEQLRYSGMLETIEIRKRGFPVRLIFDTFVFRYKPVLRGKVQGTKDQQINDILRSLPPNESDG